MTMPFRLSAPVLALVVLAGCQGDGTPPVVVTPGGSGTLGSYYVQSFAAFETAAARLRDSTARYFVQEGNWNIPSVPAADYYSYPLASARIEYAHAAGLTGAGEILSIVDSGFRQSHQVFAGKTTYSPGAIPVDDHGTAVASVAAGSSAAMVGVAPGADIAFGDFDTSATLAAATVQARTLGAVAQNNSWGYLMVASQASFNSAFAGAGGASYLAALDAYAAQGVVVFALSNDEDATVAGIMDGLPILRPSLEPGWLAVGYAVPDFDANGINSVERLSAACLGSAAWCLVADGSWYAAGAGSNSAYDFHIGTSFATPQVSGAMALLAQAFPALNPHQLRIRLLASADNGFFAANGSAELAPGFFHNYSTEFGHGFLDLRAALMPIGPVTLAMAGGQRLAVDQPLVIAGSGHGDAVERAMAGLRLEVSDGLGTGFAMPGDALAAARAPAPLAAGMAARRVAGGFADALTGLGRGAGARGLDAYPGQVVEMEGGQGGRAAILLPGTGASDGPEFGLALSQRFGEGPIGLDLGLRLGRDAGSVLGLGGALGGSADLAALSAGVTGEFAGGGFLSVSAEAGTARLSLASGQGGAANTRFDSLAVEFGGRSVLAAGDRLALSVARPVAVTAGRADLILPLRSGAGDARLRSVPLDLAPQTRQVDLTLRYLVPMGEGREMLAEIAHAENFGNRAGQSDSAAFLGFRMEF